MKGSIADVPQDLLAQIGRLEELFTVSTDKLKKITDQFTKELEKGLSIEGGDIVGVDPPVILLLLTRILEANGPYLVHGTPNRIRNWNVSRH
jgi:hexokinase